MNRPISVEAFPPGEYLQEFLDGKSWTQDDLAAVIGRTRQHVNRLLQGKTTITPETAVELASAFDTSADLWMNLQISFELSLKQEKNKGICKRAEIYSMFPVKEMGKRGWITEATEPCELENNICTFLGTNLIEAEHGIPVSARKSTSYDSDTNAQKVWYRRCWQLANNARAERYDESNLENGIEELLSLAAHPEDVRSVPKQLAEMGIRFVICEHLSGTKIDAAAFWLDDSSPVIAISLRHGRIDNFWFNLLHEIVHIKYRDSAPVDVNLEGDKEIQNDIELRANSEASNYLIPSEKLESFIRRNQPYFYQKRIVQFSQLQNVHPGITVGQLHHHPNGIKPTHMRKLLIPIRGYIIDQAVTDGWRNIDICDENFKKGLP